jgi:hypothetical protein
MLPVILTLLAATAAVPAVAEAPSQDPAVRVWLNKSGYVERTDRVRAYVRTGVDGYVVVLHAEPSGRVRVLFPLDPEDDAYVRAGRDYEIRSRSDGEAFAVYDGAGTGVVLAAVSQDPLRFEGLVLNRHWDYRAVEFGVGNDAEADLLGLVQHVTGGAWFDYDLVRYEVGSRYMAGGDDGAYHLSFYEPAYHGHSWSGHGGFSIGFGVGWYDPWYYDPWYDPWYYPRHWSAWYYPRHWTPYYYGGWYRPYRTTYAYYPHGYVTRGTERYAYPSGGGVGAWGSYAFKSQQDRYGLQPQSVTARRRTTGASTAFASSPARNPGEATRRTSAASTPASSPGRAGSLEARRRPTGAAPATVLPTVNGRGRATVPQGSGAAGNPNGADGRRTVGDQRTPVNADGAVRRGVASTPPGRAVTPPTADRRTARPSSSGPTGLRAVQPQRAGNTSARPAQGTVGSGRTTKPSSGSLERRSPPRTVAPPKSSTPSRTVSPPRSTTRSTPPRAVSPPRSTTRSAPARSAPPRAAPSRPPAQRSPPARSSSPPTRRKN